MAHGVFEADAASMKADTAIGVAAWCTVFKITTNRTANGSQLAADLMMTTSVQMYLKERISICVTYNLVIEDSFLGVCSFMVIGITFILLLVAHKIMR